MNDPAVVDSAAFARDAGELRGTIGLARLSRLHHALLDQSGEVAFALKGVLSPEQKPLLQLEVTGSLNLPCQRCLGQFNWKFESKRIFELVPPGQMLSDPADEAQEVEQIFADPKLDVIGLVEDEIILCMPMAVRHEAGACAVPGQRAESGKRESPFSVLTGIKRQ